MNVSDAMSKEACVVRMGDRLDAAARVLWEQDCGFVPVVDGAGVLVGALTDRDLCMASYTQGKALAEVPVLAAMARELATTTPDSDLKDAMKTMSDRQVRRLPVVDTRGVLVGVLSSNDLVQVSKARPAALAAKSVLETLASVGEPRSGARDFAAVGSAARSKAKPRSSKATVPSKARSKVASAGAAASAGATAKKSAAAKSSAAKSPAAKSSAAKSSAASKPANSRTRRKA
ncbi:MAG: CBS domain-containing protein [Planctomycetota bacterium]